MAGVFGEFDALCFDGALGAHDGDAFADGDVCEVWEDGVEGEDGEWAAGVEEVEDEDFQWGEAREVAEGEDGAFEV